MANFKPGKRVRLIPGDDEIITELMRHYKAPRCMEELYPKESVVEHLGGCTVRVVTFPNVSEYDIVSGTMFYESLEA